MRTYGIVCIHVHLRSSDWYLCKDAEGTDVYAELRPRALQGIDHNIKLYHIISYTTIQGYILAVLKC